MAHVVTRPPDPFPIAGTRLEVHVLPAATDNLVWLVVDTVAGQAAAVDGPGAGEVLARCDALGVRLTTILTTHTHPDHIGLHRDLDRRGRLDGLRVVGSSAPKDPIPGRTVAVEDGDVVDFGGASWRVLRTDGHQDGHVSYLVGDALFCGDTLFCGGCGYLFDGPPAAMFRSLMRLAELPGPTRVCCAHEYTKDNLRFAWSVEPDNEALAARIREVWAWRAEGRCTVPSTLDVERATNPFLRPGSPTIRESLTRSGVSVEDDVQAVFAATRAAKDTGAYKTIPDEALPLRA